MDLLLSAEMTSEGRDKDTDGEKDNDVYNFQPSSLRTFETFLLALCMPD